MEPIEFFQTAKPYFVTFHIVGVFVGMGAALFADIIFSFFGRDSVLSPKELSGLDKLSKTVWFGLTLIIVSGVGIFLSDPEFYINSSKFLSKMTVVLVLTLNGFVLYKFVQPNLFKKDFLVSQEHRKKRQLAFACGAVSLISWVSALVLALRESLPFGFVGITSVYLLVLASGIALALLVEKFVSPENVQTR